MSTCTSTTTMSGISPRFAIVGGGLSGVACLNGLIRSITAAEMEGVSITIFEPSDIIGPGVPYRIDQPYCWLLNHEADHLGTLNGGDDGFLNWILENRETISQEYSEAMRRGWVPTDSSDGLISVDAKAFYPRSLFGRFLHFCFYDLKKNAEAHGIQMEVVAQAVEAINEQDDGYLAIRDALGTQYLFDQAVLTSGHTYGPPSTTFSSQNTYVSNIYIDEKRNSMILPASSSAVGDSQRRHLGTVVVKGTGLSANDAVMWLLEQRELGNLTFDQIVMASRRGQLRKTRVKTSKYKLQYLTPDILKSRVRTHGCLSLDWLIPLVRNEIEASYGGSLMNWHDIWNPRTSDVQRNLAQSIKEAASEKAIPWRSVILALADVRQYIFEHLTDEDKRRYFGELCTLYHSYQAPMPTISAKRLWEAMENGLLKVEAGLSNISLDKTTGKYSLTFLTGEDGRPVLVHGRDENDLPSNAMKHQLEADFLIEATGQTRDVHHFQKPYPQLFDKKLLRPHNWGGIHVDPDSRQPIKANGRRWNKVWQLGINNQGDVLISNNAPNNIADGLRIGLCMVNRWNEEQKSHLISPDITPDITMPRKPSNLRDVYVQKVIRAVVHIFG
ncbi:FAD-NAD(P)-binding-domain-containing protein [Mariannaea sp. PMI_226]|nr:FAD-NAD(P)-binding-domain-containing protein [Mariannaea sp. PMI_226]